VTVAFDDVAERIAATLIISRDRLAPDTPLAELVVDSLDLVELGVELQEEFDVVFTHEDLENVATVGDLVALVQRERP
jgi:acyl carrier protein